MALPHHHPRAGLRAVAAAVAVAAGVLAWAAPAAARLNGIATAGCDGCHRDGAPAQVTLASSIASPALGQVLTLTVTVAATSGPVAGFYLESNGKGRFRAIESGTTASQYTANHTTPRQAASGVTTFKVEWTAPAQAGGVDFYAYAISANNNRMSSGDGAGSAFLTLAYGCAGTTYFLDQDGDGHGSPEVGYTRDCAQPPGHSPLDDDCDDFTPTVHPGAEEICDARDNDCDGDTDEGITLGMLCEDKDGDGHGAASGVTRMGCARTAGFAPCDLDCNDGDATIYPGAPETCNLRDDDCDGRADEQVRPTCGTGWCRRTSESCTSASACVPGAPRAEECNAFDDDCDGVIDNGTAAALCGGPNLACVRGACIPSDDPAPGGPGGTPDGGTGPAPKGNGCSLIAPRPLPSPVLVLVGGLILVLVPVTRRRR